MVFRLGLYVIWYGQTFHLESIYLFYLFVINNHAWEYGSWYLWPLARNKLVGTDNQMAGWWGNCWSRLSVWSCQEGWGQASGMESCVGPQPRTDAFGEKWLWPLEGQKLRGGISCFHLSSLTHTPFLFSNWSVLWRSVFLCSHFKGFTAPARRGRLLIVTWCRGNVDIALRFHSHVCCSVMN